MNKVMSTPAAQSLLDTLRATNGPLVLVHSEGCCDGTFPLCMTATDFRASDSLHQIGLLGDVPYYMHASNQTYWQHVGIVVDVVEGIGNSFSLESTLDQSFILRAQPL